MKSPTHQSLSCNPRRFVSRCRQQQRVLGPLFARPRLTQHAAARSEEHTSELQSQSNLVCRLLLEKKKKEKVQIVLRPRGLSQIWQAAELDLLSCTDSPESSTTVRPGPMPEHPMLHVHSIR